MRPHFLVSLAIAGFTLGSCGGTTHGPTTPPSTPITEAETQGGLTAAQIRSAIQANIGQVQHCYEEGLARRPTLAGRVTVSFEIGASGRVDSSHVEDETLGDPEVARCVNEHVATWVFPEPSPPGRVTVRFPFNLSQTNDASSVRSN